LPLAIQGELVTPGSTDIEGHKKGQGKRVKKRTRTICYLGLNEDKVAFKSTTILKIVIGEYLEHVFLLALIPSTKGFLIFLPFQKEFVKCKIL
jgi:hypothetical protein